MNFWISLAVFIAAVLVVLALLWWFGRELVTEALRLVEQSTLTSDEREELEFLRQVAEVRLVNTQADSVVLDMNARDAFMQISRTGEPLTIGGYHTKQGFTLIRMVHGGGGGKA